MASRYTSNSPPQDLCGRGIVKAKVTAWVCMGYLFDSSTITIREMVETPKSAMNAWAISTMEKSNCTGCALAVVPGWIE